MSFIFSTRLLSMDSQYEGGPIGQPSRVKPSLVFGMSDGKYVDCGVVAPGGMDTRDLL